MSNYTIHNMTTAMCLWEEIQQLLSESEEINANAHHARRFVQRGGTWSARETVADFAPLVDNAWEKLPEDLQDTGGCFDWEVIPALLDRILPEMSFPFAISQEEVDRLMLEVTSEESARSAKVREEARRGEGA